MLSFTKWTVSLNQDCNMAFMKIYKKYFKIAALIWAGCFVLILFAYILVVKPQKDNKKRLESVLAERKQMHESALKAAQEETKIQLHEQIERLRDRLEDFVIDSENSANLTFDVSQIASEKKIASFSITSSKDSRRVSTIPNCNYIRENRIDVDFTAGFNQFAIFLNALERHRPAIFIDRFTITRSERDYSGPKVSMELVVLVEKQQDS